MRTMARIALGEFPRMCIPVCIKSANFATQMLRVRRQVGRINGEVREAPLKTKNAYRTISLGTDAIGVLRQQREKQPSSYIFPFPSGTEESGGDHGCRAGGIAENHFCQNRVFRILKARF